MPRAKRSVQQTAAAPPPATAAETAVSFTPPFSGASALPILPLSSASFAISEHAPLPGSSFAVAPLLPRINQQADNPQPEPIVKSEQQLPARNKKRGRPFKSASSTSSPSSSSSPPQPPPEDVIDTTIDAAASHTYPDPADTDTNPAILPAYLPSLLPSPDLFQHVLHHFSAFHLRYGGLASAIATTSGTLSAVLHRKYAFKAIGVVRGLREWMSRRDEQVARLIAADIRRQWVQRQGDVQQQQQQQQQAGDEKQQQSIEWEHPAFSREAVELLLPGMHSGLKYEVLMDFLRHRVSVTKKQRVEDMLVEYITKLEATDNSGDDSKQTAVKQEEKAAGSKKKKKKKKDEQPQPTVTGPLSASGRQQRPNSAQYYNEAALAGVEDYERPASPDEAKAVKVDEDFVETEQPSADEDEEIVEKKIDETRMAKKKRKGRPRSSTEDSHVYTLNDEPRWPTRTPFQSPFSHPSWSMRSTVTHPFDAASYSPAGTAALSFQASGSPVTLQPFTAVSSPSSSAPTATPSLLLHAGGSIDAIAWAPVGSPAVSPSATAHYLLVAPSHSKYRSYAPHSKPGVLCLWRVRQQNEAAMVLAIEHDRGGVMDMRWYPHGVWQEEGSGDGRGRLGVLAAGFTDGSVVVLAVPHPLPDEAGMRAVHLSSLPHVVLTSAPNDCRLSLPLPVPTSLAFSPHASPAYLAIGQSHSAVVIYALSTLNPASTSHPPAPSFHLIPRPGHQAVRALTFSATNPHHLLLATNQGDILLLDLRSPYHPLATIPAHTSEPITALHHLPTRPSALVTTSRNRPRLHFLLRETADVRTLALRGLPSLRGGREGGTCWCVDVLSDEQCGATIAVCGWSDGRVDAIAWRTAESEVDTVGLIRRVCWFGWGTGGGGEGGGSDGRRLVVGEGGGAVRVSRVKVDVVELDGGGEERVELSGVELALDEHLAVQHVQWNPNVIFPRQVAVGVLAGIVRIQQVNDM